MMLIWVGRFIVVDSKRASCSWSVCGRWICIWVELNRRDYELIIISRSSIYGGVDHKRSILEISFTLSLAYQEWCHIEMFLEVLERGEIPVWWVGCWICFLQWGCIIDETLGVRWDGYGIHMIGWWESYYIDAVVSHQSFIAIARFFSASFTSLFAYVREYECCLGIVPSLSPLWCAFALSSICV